MVKIHVLLLTIGMICVVVAQDVVPDPSQVEQAQSQSQSQAQASTPIDPSIPEFIPTNEWQTILPGQSIPPGLWVRMNVYEGTREARLLPPTEQPIPSTHRKHKHHDTTSTPTTDDQRTLLLPQPSHDTSSQHIPHIQKSIEELRADLADLNSLFQPESVGVMERVHALMNIISATPTSEIITILEELEELTHQIDHAVDMYTAGGLIPLLDMISQHGMICNNRNIEEILSIRYYAVWLLGVTTQNIPITATQARDANVISTLIHLFMHPTTPHPQPHDTQYHDMIRKLQSKIIFALSSLLRNSAKGQDQFIIISDGLSTLHHYLVTPTHTRQDVILRDKILTLISDMLTDRLINGAHMGMENVSSPRLFDALTSDVWCTTYQNLLSNIEHESDTRWIQTVIDMMSMLMEGHVCASYITQDRINHARHVGQRLELLNTETQDFTQPSIDLVIDGANADHPHDAAAHDQYANEMADLTQQLIQTIALVDGQPPQQQV